MQRDPHPCARRRALRLPRLCLLSLSAALAAACSEPVVPTPAPEARLSASAAEFTGEVIIKDEEWIDRTVEETPVEIPDYEPAGSEGFGVMSTPQPIIRVGVVYAELNATQIRVGGRDGSDVFELRGGSATGPVLRSGLVGELVAMIQGSGPTARIRIPVAVGDTVIASGPVVLVSQSGLVRLPRTPTDRSVYRGTAEVRFNSARTRLVGVNELPIEEYLYGVVPRELGPIAFPLIEALKTQAVAARTFARRRMQFCGAARCGHGYHVLPTTTDQVYGGFNAEHSLSTQAVDETRGEVGTYNGALIEGLYSSTSGGWTANSEDVFVAKLPYLRGLPDSERGQAMEHVPTLEVFKRHANPRNLRNEAENDFESDWSRYHRWYVHWTREEMRQVAGRIQSATFIDPGEVYEIRVVQRADQGRVVEMHFVTEKRGTLVARKSAIRSALRYVTYNSAGNMVLNSLRSTLVFVQPQHDPQTKQIVGWEAWGGGWGHGVGMSQTGAVGMAEKGRTYREILAHYYHGVVLQKRWD